MDEQSNENQEKFQQDIIYIYISTIVTSSSNIYMLHETKQNIKY